MITGDSREASAEFENHHLEVRVSIEVSRDDTPSVNELLYATQNVLHGALTSLGIPGADAVLATWHQEMAMEARQTEEF